MKRKKQEVDIIEQAFIHAHQRRTGPQLTPAWNRKVMREIRNIHASTGNKQNGLLEVFALDRMVFRLATVVGLATIIATLSTFDSLIAVQYDILNRLLEESVDANTFLLAWL